MILSLPLSKKKKVQSVFDYFNVALNTVPIDLFLFKNVLRSQIRMLSKY